MCPDAYSYAFDDQTSTFIIPSGGGWEIVFCPAGRSTTILATFTDELHKIAESGQVTQDILLKAMNMSYIESKHSTAAGIWVSMARLALTVVLAVSNILA